MKNIKRKDCAMIRAKLNAALAEVGKELGLDIRAGNASYDDTSVKFKVECICEGADKEKENFEAECGYFHLPATAYKAEFQRGGQTWILEGLKPNRPKYPILASKKGKAGNYKLPRSAIESLQEIPTVKVVPFCPETSENLKGNGTVGV